MVPICVGQRNPWHSNDWSCKGIGQWPHKALKLINVTLERPSRNNCDGFMTIARSLKKSNLLINGYSKPLQWLRETIAMASQNHCNGFAKPLQWKWKKQLFLSQLQWLCETSNGFAKPAMALRNHCRGRGRKTMVLQNQRHANRRKMKSFFFRFSLLLFFEYPVLLSVCLSVCLYEKFNEIR